MFTVHLHINADSNKRKTNAHGESRVASVIKGSNYSRAPVYAESVSTVSVIGGLPRPEKKLKFKEINGS
jgi:hypothetical protein